MQVTRAGWANAPSKRNRPHSLLASSPVLTAALPTTPNLTTAHIPPNPGASPTYLRRICWNCRSSCDAREARPGKWQGFGDSCRTLSLDPRRSDVQRSLLLTAEQWVAGETDDLPQLMRATSYGEQS